MLALVVPHTKKKEGLPELNWFSKLVKEHDVEHLLRQRSDRDKTSNRIVASLILHVEPGSAYDGPLTVWDKKDLGDSS
eukprot:6491399-Amphidinium_carterae.1